MLIVQYEYLNTTKGDHQSRVEAVRRNFTDRGHGEGLVLSETTSGSWREDKHVKTNRVDP
jgi:hypothetical protein